MQPGRLGLDFFEVLRALGMQRWRALVWSAVKDNRASTRCRMVDIMITKPIATMLMDKRTLLKSYSKNVLASIYEVDFEQDPGMCTTTFPR